MVDPERRTVFVSLHSRVRDLTALYRLHRSRSARRRPFFVPPRSTAVARRPSHSVGAPVHDLSDSNCASSCPAGRLSLKSIESPPRSTVRFCDLRRVRLARLGRAKRYWWILGTRVGPLGTAVGFGIRLRPAWAAVQQRGEKNPRLVNEQCEGRKKFKDGPIQKVAGGATPRSPRF